LLLTWDNDVPGYTATRLLWADEFICEKPEGPGRVFILAHDRDFLAAVRCDAGEATAALNLLWQIRVLREGTPRTLLPDTPLALTPSGMLHPVEFRPPASGLLVPLH
jgi:hypothetical protein